MHFLLCDSYQITILSRNLISITVIFGFYRDVVYRN